jgi:hypothetical protein
MDKLREVLAQAGVSRSALDKMDEAQVKQLARALKIDPTPFLPRNVKIEEGKNGARYVVTEGFAVPKFKDKKAVTGENSLAKNLYLRVEAIDQAIEDLLAAKALITK